MTGARIPTTRLSLIGFTAILMIAWFCYRPALSGAFQLDDAANLAGLAYVEDTQTLLDFVLAGSNGPLGRPLAMLSFGLQAGDFESGPRAFMRTNVLIHIVNAALLLWFCYRLALARTVERNRAMLIGASAASLWVLLPLLATASLLVVQRMTTLSALFVLAGLGAYLVVLRH